VVDEWDHEEIVTTDVVRRRIIVAATSGLLDEVRALGAP
jgi:hypothetical protein